MISLCSSAFPTFNPFKSKRSRKRSQGEGEGKEKGGKAELGTATASTEVIENSPLEVFNHKSVKKVTVNESITQTFQTCTLGGKHAGEPEKKSITFIALPSQGNDIRNIRCSDQLQRSEGKDNLKGSE